MRALLLGNLERRVLLASDVPGVVLRSALAPGSTTGATVLVIEAKHQPVNTVFLADNTLPRTLGPWQLGTGFDFNSVFGLGELVYVRGTVDPNGGTNGGRGGGALRLCRRGRAVPGQADGAGARAHPGDVDAAGQLTPGSYRLLLAAGGGGGSGGSPGSTQAGKGAGGVAQGGGGAGYKSNGGTYKTASGTTRCGLTSSNAKRTSRDPGQGGPQGRNPCDFAMYRWRHLVANVFCDLKQNRRVATRYDKTYPSFAAFIHLAATRMALRSMSTGLSLKLRCPLDSGRK